MYAEKPFAILGFPCNQFGLQEPGANASEIFAVLKYIRPGDGFVPKFDMFKKDGVNGKDENPIYTFLKSRCSSPKVKFRPVSRLYYEPLHADDIRWNFEKFLVDCSGNPMRRYDASLDPMALTEDIDYLLEKDEHCNSATTVATGGYSISVQLSSN